VVAVPGIARRPSVRVLQIAGDDDVVAIEHHACFVPVIFIATRSGTPALADNAWPPADLSVVRRMTSGAALPSLETRLDEVRTDVHSAVSSR
jgi:hypothetical protein